MCNLWAIRNGLVKNFRQGLIDLVSATLSDGLIDVQFYAGAAVDTIILQFSGSAASDVVKGLTVD